MRNTHGNEARRVSLVFAVRVGPVDPKSRLRDISREVAQKAGEMRGMHIPRKDSERSGQRRPESHHRGTESRGGRALNMHQANLSLLQPLRNSVRNRGIKG